MMLVVMMEIFINFKKCHCMCMVVFLGAVPVIRAMFGMGIGMIVE